MKNNIFELIGEIKNNSFDNRVDITSLCNYDGANYLSDIINEICDSNIDIYNDDLFEWATNNFDCINEAKKEFGPCDDIIKEIQQGQFLANQNEIYNNLKDMLHIYIYNILKENDIQYISDSTLSQINDIVNTMYNEDRLFSSSEILSSDGLLENLEEDKKGGVNNG